MLHGANLSSKDLRGRNVFHHVAIMGNSLMLQLLIKYCDKKEIIDDLDFKKLSPLDLASEKKNDCMKILLDLNTAK